MWHLPGCSQLLGWLCASCNSFWVASDAAIHHRLDRRSPPRRHEWWIDDELIYTENVAQTICSVRSCVSIRVTELLADKACLKLLLAWRYNHCFSLMTFHWLQFINRILIDIRCFYISNTINQSIILFQVKKPIKHNRQNCEWQNIQRKKVQEKILLDKSHIQPTHPACRLLNINIKLLEHDSIHCLKTFHIVQNSSKTRQTSS